MTVGATKSVLKNSVASNTRPQSLDMRLTVSPLVDCARDAEDRRRAFAYTQVMRAERICPPTR